MNRLVIAGLFTAATAFTCLCLTGCGDGGGGTAQYGAPREPAPGQQPMMAPGSGGDDDIVGAGGPGGAASPR